MSLPSRCVVERDEEVSRSSPQVRLYTSVPGTSSCPMSRRVRGCGRCKLGAPIVLVAPTTSARMYVSGPTPAPSYPGHNTTRSQLIIDQLWDPCEMCDGETSDRPV